MKTRMRPSVFVASWDRNWMPDPPLALSCHKDSVGQLFMMEERARTVAEDPAFQRVWYEQFGPPVSPRES
jgi:hypothetical protein